MTKKSKAQANQAATPETEWPQSGGSYSRDLQTGRLTKSDPAIAAQAGIQSNPNPAKPDTSEEV